MYNFNKINRILSVCTAISIDMSAFTQERYREIRRLCVRLLEDDEYKNIILEKISDPIFQTYLYKNYKMEEIFLYNGVFKKNGQWVLAAKLIPDVMSPLAVKRSIENHISELKFDSMSDVEIEYALEKALDGEKHCD